MKKSICFVVSAPGSAQSFLRDHIRELSKDYDIALVANFADGRKITIDGVSEYRHIPIRRGISPLHDLKAIWSLYRYLSHRRFDVTHSVTPKAGMVTALASKMAGITHRIHIFTGQVWATRTGAMRRLLKSIDRLIARCDTHLLVDGEPQRRFLIAEGVLADDSSQVLGAGSICGADTRRFTPSPEIRNKWRARLGIDSTKTVFVFMGRLNREKGVFDLLRAFDRMCAYRSDAYLLMFGTDEENCMTHLAEYKDIRPGENFQYFGRTDEPQHALQAGDVFCLPSYREGFGLSVVEASCLGLPVICSDAYGLADTMVNNKTGMRCGVGDTDSLCCAMEYLYDNPSERQRLGQNGRERVLTFFSGEAIVSAWAAFYHDLLR